MLDKNGLKKLLAENYLLLIVLVGAMLISLSIGPFQNGDTQWEFAAAAGVMKWGIPYVNSFGLLMNQPPLGFYVEALFLEVVGSSITSGTLLITLFGLGSTVLLVQAGQGTVWQTNRIDCRRAFRLKPVATGSFAKLPHRHTMSILQPSLPIRWSTRHPREFNEAFIGFRDFLRRSSAD